MSNEQSNDEKDFDISKYGGTDIKSFSLRSQTGHDVVSAIGRLPRNLAGLPAQGYEELKADQMIAGLLSKVDGQPVPGVCMQYFDWNERTRMFVKAAYNRMGGVTQPEMMDFFETHFGESKSASSESGSGSPGT